LQRAQGDALGKLDLEGVVGEGASIGEGRGDRRPESVDVVERSAASAARRRQGLCATPPTASRAERMRLPSVATAAAAETSANS